MSSREFKVEITKHYTFDKDVLAFKIEAVKIEAEGLGCAILCDFAQFDPELSGPHALPVMRVVSDAIAWAWMKAEADEAAAVAKNAVAVNCADVAAIPCMTKADGTPIPPGHHPLDRLFETPQSWRDKPPLI